MLNPHLVNPSPWPALSALSALSSIVTPARRFHNYVGSFAEVTFSLTRPARPFHNLGSFVTRRARFGLLSVVGTLPGDLSEADALFGGAPLVSIGVLFGVAALVFGPDLAAAWLTHAPRRHPFVFFQPAIAVVYLVWLVAGFLWERAGLPPVPLFSLDQFERGQAALAGYATLFLTTHLRNWYQGVRSHPAFGPFWWFPFIFLFLVVLDGHPKPVGVLLLWMYTSFGVHYLIVHAGYGLARLGWDFFSLYESEPPVVAVPPRVGVEAAKITAAGTVAAGTIVFVNGIYDRRHQREMVVFENELNFRVAAMKEQAKTERFNLILQENHRHNKEMERIAQKSRGWFSSSLAESEPPGWADLFFDRHYLVWWAVARGISLFVGALVRWFRRR